MTECKVGQDGTFGEADPLTFNISYVGKINLNLKFKHIPGMPKERDTEAAKVLMRSIEIRESDLQFIVCIDGAQVVVDFAADP